MFFKGFKSWAWEKKSNLAIALVFGGLALLNVCLTLWTAHKIDATTIILVCVAASPLLLPLLAKHVEELSIGILKIRPASKTAAEVRIEQEKAPAPVIQESAIPEFNQWPQEARKILGTLWKNQRAIFQNMDQRFGFKVERPSMMQPSYINGISWLRQWGLIVYDDRGFSFLSDAGIAYCKEHTVEIDKQSDLYEGFRHYFGP